MKRYRLLAKAQINGILHDVGYEFEAPDDWVGPKKAVLMTPDLHASSIDAVQDGPFTGPFAPKVTDIPLYEEIVESAPVVEEEPATAPRMIEFRALVDKIDSAGV